MNRDLEAEWAAESAQHRRAEIERLQRKIDAMSPRDQSRATALALTMRIQELQRAQEQPQ